MIVEFASLKGVELFKSTDLIGWTVIESFFPQENEFYCGVATLKTLLNADKLEKNGFVTCEHVFTEDVEAIRTRDQVVGRCKQNSSPGINLDEYYKVSTELFANTELFSGECLEREALVSGLTTQFAACYWVFNFQGSVLGIRARGHYAVLGGWNQESEMLLLLDPARHQDGWFWVHVDVLLDSMTHKDEKHKNGRGYVKIKRRGRYPDC